LGFAVADFFGFVFEFLDGADGEVGAAEGVVEVLAFGVDGDAAFGDDDVDELAGAGDCGYLVNDDGDAVAEQGDRENDGFAEEAVLPAADAVQEASV